MSEPMKLSIQLEYQAPRANMQFGADPRMTTDRFQQQLIEAETSRIERRRGLAEAGFGRLRATNRTKVTKSGPRPERLHRYEDESKATKGKKDKLLERLKAWAPDRKVLNLIPEDHIPVAFFLPRDMSQATNMIAAPKDWNVTFLDKLDRATSKARGDYELLLGKMTDAVEMRLDADEGTQELVGKDLDEVIKMLKRRDRQFRYIGGANKFKLVLDL